MLDNHEGMFHLGPDARMPAIAFLLRRRQGMLAIAAVRQSIIETVCSGLAFVRLLGTGAVAEQCLFVSVLQRLQQLPVMHLRHGELGQMNNGVSLRLHANIPFGAKMPCTVLAGRNSSLGLVRPC